MGRSRRALRGPANPTLAVLTFNDDGSKAFGLDDRPYRRRVDYGTRDALLRDLEVRLAADAPDREVEIRALLDSMADGRIKLFLTTVGLRFRRTHPDFMARATYVPLTATGPGADHVVAFARHDESGI